VAPGDMQHLLRFVDAGHFVSPLSQHGGQLPRTAADVENSGACRQTGKHETLEDGQSTLAETAEMHIVKLRQPVVGSRFHEVDPRSEFQVNPALNRPALLYANRV